MQALLLSPATRFSPDSSSSSSPSTPLPSLDFLAQLGDSPLGGGFDTPTRATPAQSTLRNRAPAGTAPDPPATPSWLTDELGEEWAGDPHAQEPAEPAQGSAEDYSTASTAFALPSSVSGGSTTILPPDRTLQPDLSQPASTLSTPSRVPDAAYASLPKTQPRVPSSLRHAFTASTSTAATTVDADGTRDMSVVEASTADNSVVLHEQSGPDAGEDSVGSAGTCVVNSIVERSGAAGGDEGQLAAAVRALRGPNAGLFSAGEGGEGDAAEGQTEEAPRAPQSKVGLLGLFDPPSPSVQPPPLPRSTRPAPSLPSFTFSPPDPVPRTSWKSLPLLSPSPSPPRTDTDATPLARSTRAAPAALETPTAAGPAATPQQRDAGAGPAPTGPGRRERFFKRSAPAPPVASTPPRVEDDAESSDDAAFVPPPQTGTTTSESEGLSDDNDEEDEGGLGLAGPGQPGLGWSSDEDEQSSFSQDDGELSLPERSMSALPSPPAAPSSAYLGLPRPPSPRALPASPARIPFPSPALSAGAPPPPSPLRLFQPTYDTITRQHLAQLVDEIDDLGAHREEYLLSGAPAPPSLAASQGALPEGDSDEGFLGEEGEKRSAKRIRLSPRSERELSILEEEAEGDGDGDENTSFSRATPRSRRRTSLSPISTRRRTPALRRARAYTPSSARSSARSSALRTSGLPSLPRPALRDSARSELSSVGSSPGGGRARERLDEANALMERIRIRVEERELRRKGGQSPVPEQEEAFELAAAASASLRSVLSSPAPASSAPPGSPLALGLPPSVKAAKEKGGSLGRRHFARTPVGGSAKKVVAGGVKGPAGSLLARTHQRGLFGSDADDADAEVESLAPASPALSPAQEDEADALGALPPPRPPPSAARHARHSSLTTLHPASLDTQRLLASAGASARQKGLVFDAQRGRWIRTPRRAGLAESVAEPEIVEEVEDEGEEEDDPFRDFSELRSGNASGAAAADLDALPHAGDRSGSLPRGGPVLGRTSALLDLSGLGITKGSPSLMAPAQPAKVVEPSPAGACYFEEPPAEDRPEEEGADGPQLVLESEDSATWGRGDAQGRLRTAETLPIADDEPQEAESEDELAESSMLGLYRAAHAALGDDATEEMPAAAPAQAPLPATPASVVRISAPTSRPESAPTPIPAVPRSALKPTRAQSDPATYATSAGTSTPLRATSEPPRVPRSVSFSDGKTSGKIEGLVSTPQAPPFRPLGFGSRLKFEVGGEGSEGPGSLEFDEAFETQSEEEGEDADRTVTQDSVRVEEGPSARTRGIGAALDDLARGPDDSPFGTHFSRNPLNSSVIVSSASASPVASRPLSASRSFTRTHSQNGNATFLTECSFGVSHDRLLQYITDVEPFEPDWEHLRSIDLSGKKAESVVRMKEFLPRLDEVNLNRNELSYLTGIPKTLRTLLISSNRLTSLTSFQHLANLERLDLSNNQLDSVHQLACLRHLQELKLDGNQIASLDGLSTLDSLVKLSLKGNALVEVDLSSTSWSRLETLHIARNKLALIKGVERLVSLTTLNLDHNNLASFESAGPLLRLRVLRLSNNPIASLDASFAPKLRTLYIDSARLGDLLGTDQLRKLENLSVRDQSGGALMLPMPHIRDVKRLYLSGNPLPSSFPSEKFYNLVYLELAMCQLTSLPADFASVVPNVRVLNLDFNFISDLAPLTGLTRLTKLSVVGARLAKARPVAAVLATLTELESVDLRMNPFTLAFYPPLVPPSDSLLPSHAEHRILHPDDLPTSLSASTLADPATHSAAWLVLDTKFRRALPDEWYHRRAAYRAVIMQAVPSLAKLDGVDCAKERPRLARRVEKLAKKAAAAA
ncbi:Protein nud1 [Rhodotorula kratochvilovae]